MNYRPYRIHRVHAANGGVINPYFIQPLLVVAGIVAAIGLALTIAAAAPIFLIMKLIPNRAGVDG